jgi:hypothetical protein
MVVSLRLAVYLLVLRLEKLWFHYYMALLQVSRHFLDLLHTIVQPLLKFSKGFLFPTLNMLPFLETWLALLSPKFQILLPLGVSFTTVLNSHCLFYNRTRIRNARRRNSNVFPPKQDVTLHSTSLLPDNSNLVVAWA